MTWLSQEPWYLVITLSLISSGFFLALKLRQERKYLICAVASFVLACLVLLVERVWITDAERIEGVVQEIARAVQRSEADTLLSHFTDDITLTQEHITLGGPQVELLRRVVPGADPAALNPAKALIRSTVESCKFDFVMVRKLRTEAGRLTRRGKAEFRVYSSGIYTTSLGSFSFATGAQGSDWSLGFRMRDGQWKVDRITAVRLPPNFRIPGMGEGPR